MKIRKVIIALLLSVALLCATVTPAAAGLPVVPSTYALTYRTGLVYGGYFTAYLQACNAGYVNGSNVPNAVNKAIWMTLDNSIDYWIEIGFTDGAVDDYGSGGDGGPPFYNYHGWYFAKFLNDGAGYRMRVFSGPSTANGTHHAWEIQKIGTNKWAVYIDFIQRASFTATNPPSNAMMYFGWEGNQANNNTPYVAYNESGNHQYRTSGGTWYNWTSGGLINTCPYIRVAWKQSGNYTNAKFNY
ncbi:MAG: hypothetical protein IBX64_05260 [Actinobacteria bacterium]|nr:hypothetical protein [Actinomycetota bacterium]